MAARLLMVILATMLVAGCKAGDPAAAPTGEFDLALYSRNATGSETYYIVSRDATLGFGGGLDARLGRTTWTGPLLPDEMTHLRQLLDSCGWFRAKPVATKQPPEQIYRVSIHSKQSSRSFQIKGEHPDIAPIRELLDGASRRRLEVDLRRLPQPSNREQTPPNSAPPAPPATAPQQ